eukprot:7362228-Prymnesium_polylepis.2
METWLQFILIDERFAETAARAGARPSAHRPSCPSDRLDTHAHTGVGGRICTVVPTRYGSRHHAGMS